MRILRIFLLHLQSVLVMRSRSFVWFLLALVNPLILLAFWYGSYQSNTANIPWSFSSVSIYYLLLVVAGALLMAHVEEDVGVIDIQRGELVKYLLKPFNYFWLKFFEEWPWRLLQGAFGLITFTVIFLVFKNQLTITISLPSIFASLCVAILGFFISYIFKMIVGLSAFWIVEFRGLQQLVEVLSIIFGGFVMPLEFFPPLLRIISFGLPFAYMIYFPIVTFLNQLSPVQIMQVLGMQLSWIILLLMIYRWLWLKGTQKFSGVGQ